MIKINICFAFFVLFISMACNQKTHTDRSEMNYFDGGKISVDGTRFIDSYGRQVIFSGFNYVNKNPDENYINKDSAIVFEQFKKWGVNCIRLGIIWDGVEPEPGKFNEKYLDQIEQKVKWAEENNVYVFLDMHQDLYSKKFSDGAPLWATLDENLPHVTGSIWSDAYLMSPAVQKAFDNFWANKPAADGIGIQDHYIKMWQHIAKRFSKYANVIGYDIMNEPFNGSPANEIMPFILKEYATMVAESGKTPPGEKELMMIWADEKSRLEVLKQLGDAKKYARILDAAYEANKLFETTALQSFYQKVSDSIRAIDSTGIIFLEHGYFVNPGIRTAIEPVKDKDGKPYKNQAYAAHGYDLLVDTEEADSPNGERHNLIFTRINETSKRLNMPVLIGEWGAFSGSQKSNSTSSARFIIGLFEKYHFSNTYWAYGNSTSNLPYFEEALIRTYPQYISGTLVSYSHNREKGEFKLSWDENPKIEAPTIIYVSDIKSLIKESMKLSSDNGNVEISSIENSNGGYIIIPVCGKSGERTIEFRFNLDSSSISFEKKK